MDCILDSYHDGGEMDSSHMYGSKHRAYKGKPFLVSKQDFTQFPAITVGQDNPV